MLANSSDNYMLMDMVYDSYGNVMIYVLNSRGRDSSISEGEIYTLGELNTAEPGARTISLRDSGSESIKESVEANLNANEVSAMLY